MAANKRQSISKKTRFEIFKRDSFCCQYCGAKAPDVVLHVDHNESHHVKAYYINAILLNRRAAPNKYYFVDIIKKAFEMGVTPEEMIPFAKQCDDSDIFEDFVNGLIEKKYDEQVEAAA